MDGVVLLPQTAFRIWGIYLPPTNFYQAEYIAKFSRDTEITESIYQLNSLILGHVGHNVAKFLSRDENLHTDSSELIVDCQVLNLKHHYRNIPWKRKIIIVDYSNLGHRNVNITDWFPINHFFRSLIKVLKFNRKQKIAELWNMRMDWERNSTAFSELFWKNKYLDLERIKELSQSFLRMNANRFPDIAKLNLDGRILLICPHTDQDLAGLLVDIKNLLQKSFSASEIFYSVDEIYVKQHRISQVQLPDKINFLSREIKVINDPLTRILPTEIFTLGLENCFLFSTISSILFSADSSRTWSLGSISKKDLKDYGFMLGRARRANIHFEFNLDSFW